ELLNFLAGPLVKGIIWILERIFQKKVEERISIYLVGANGVGKTTFMTALKNQLKFPDDIRDYKRTSGLVSHSIEHSIGKEKYKLLFYDYAGDSGSIKTRDKTIVEKKPIVILFFVDHNNTRELIPKDKRNASYSEIEEWENENKHILSEISQTRIDDQYEHFDSLIQLFKEGTIHKNVTIILVATKYDLWHPQLETHDFHTNFQDKIRELLTQTTNVSNINSISSLKRHGLERLLNEICKVSAREYKIFNWTFQRYPLQ
ncbi:MAG: GTPase, partial [Chloroflexota bacterium]